MDIRRKILLLSLLLFFFLTTSHAQMAMGAWRTHFSYNNVQEITESAEKIYAISNGALFSVDKEYESIETYSKINGLSDGEIAHIAYSKENDLLLIAYSNSNIDLLKGRNMINISDLKRKEISDKEINNISFHNQYAYLSCGFGILVVNVRRNEIADTYIIGDAGAYLQINAVEIVGNYIYALTETGIRYADIRNSNLSNFANWTVLPDPDATSGNSRAIASFNGELVLLKGNSIYRYNGSEWNVFRENSYFSAINVSGENITFFGNNTFARFDKNWTEREFRELSSIRDLIFSPSQNSYWVAQYILDEEQTILTKHTNGTFENRFIPNGTFSGTKRLSDGTYDRVARVAFVKHRFGKLIAGSGGPRELPLKTPGVIQLHENNKWTVIRKQDAPSGILCNTIRFEDVLDIEIDPRNYNRMYVATFGKGLFVLEDNQLVAHFDQNNSPLFPHDPRTCDYGPLLNGLCFDKNNNLWMLNMDSPDLLKVRKADGTWGSLFYPNVTKKITTRELFISKNGYKWILIPRVGEGVFVINDRGNPFVSASHQTRFFANFQETGSNETVTPTTYRSIAEDKNGAIWIGTNMGPLIISNPDNVFNDNFTIDRIKITREDNESLADYLLESETINAIAVDGGNRKWLATESSGLYLLSPNGQETIHHFTTENSPLTSNAIMDLAINDQTGEVFIVSASALYSFKSDATEGAPSFDNVYVYPNPVRANYTGLITIAGLMERSVVKIADVQGNLIHQGNSNGGVFTWDGKNLRGQRVGTGVYLVFAALSDGSEKMVTKIAVIN